MKRLLALILAMLMCVSLAACGGDKESEEGKTDETNSEGKPVENGEEDGEDEAPESELDKILKRVAKRELVLDSGAHAEDMGKVSEQLFYDADGALIYRLRYHQNGFPAEWCEFEGDGEVSNNTKRDCGRGETSSWQVMQETEYEYKDGKVVKSVRKNSKDEVTSVVNYEYDSMGSLIKTSTADANGEISSYTEYSYDDAGNCIKEKYVIVDNLDRNSYSTYKYDSNGNKIEYVYHLSDEDSETKECYDSEGRIIKEEIIGTDGVVKESNTYEYDTDGNLIRFHKDGRYGYTMKYEYNADGKVIKEARNGRSTTYSYDANGNCIKIETTNYIYTMEYDKNGNQTKWAMTEPDNTEDPDYNYSFTYEYDANGFRTKSAKYDKDGNLVAEYK